MKLLIKPYYWDIQIRFILVHNTLKNSQTQFFLLLLLSEQYFSIVVIVSITLSLIKNNYYKVLEYLPIISNYHLSFSTCLGITV